MTYTQLQAEAKKIVNDFACDTQDKTEARDLIDLYESIVKLAIDHSEDIEEIHVKGAS
jgi:hypothetical protein